MKQTINTGSSANDGTGSSLRAGMTAINANFSEVYGAHITKYRTTDSAASTGSYAIDDTIQVDLEAGDVVFFEMTLKLSGNGIIKFDGPAGMQAVIFMVGDGSLTTPSDVSGQELTLNNVGIAKVSGILNNPTNAGVFGLYTKDGDSSQQVMALSFAEFKKQLTS